MNARKCLYSVLPRSPELLRSQRGMSLIEILIVMTLIAVAGTFVTTNVIESMHRANRDAAKAQIGNFKGMLEEYARYCNRYPSTDQGLDALAAKPTVPPECANYPSGGILKDGKVPLDPWKKPYVYSSEDGRSYLIVSYARDGKEGGEKGSTDEDVKSNDL